MKTNLTKLGRRAPRAGFTLMEMILVLAIIALLVGGGVALMTNVMADAKDGRAKGDISAIETALIRYGTLTGGQFPNSIGEMTKAGGKLTRQLLKPSAANDPWGHPYVLRRPGKRNPTGYDIYSIGDDGQDGTADDIGNWDRE